MARNINLNSNLLQFRDLSVLWSYKKLVKQAHHPIPFNVYSDDLWRYSGIRYGSFFDKHLCNHVVFFSMGLKKNIGLLLPFLINFKVNKLKSIPKFNFWPKHSYIYENSLIYKVSAPFFKGEFSFCNITNKNLFPAEDFFKFSPFYKFILRKRLHRVLNTWDIDINSSVSNYNAGWKGGKKIETYNSRFFLDHIPIISSRSGYLDSSFFINFTDPRKVIYPEKFFQNEAIEENFLKYFNFSKYFNFGKKNYIFKGFYNDFYYNLFYIFLNLWSEKILYRLSSYYSIFKFYNFSYWSISKNYNFLNYLNKNLLFLDISEENLFVKDNFSINILPKNSINYKFSNQSCKNLIFKFYFYSAWVAKRFFRITNWFNLNFFSLKKKNWKYDLNFMVGSPIKHGPFSKWSLRFLNKKQKKFILNSKHTLRMIRKVKKHVYTNKRMRAKVYFSNRDFLAAKKKFLKRISRVFFIYSLKKKKIKSGYFLKKNQQKKKERIFKALIEGKITRLNALKKKGLLMKKKLTEIVRVLIEKKKNLKKKDIAVKKLLNSKIIAIKLKLKNLTLQINCISKAIACKEHFKKEEMASNAVKLLKQFNLKMKKNKEMIKYSKLSYTLLKKSIGPHRRWYNPKNLKQIGYYYKWKKKNDRILWNLKNRIIFNLAKIYKPATLLVKHRKKYADVVKKSCRKVLIATKKKGAYYDCLKNFYIVKYNKWLKKKIKLIGNFRALKKDNAKRLYRPRNLNKKNRRMLLQYLGYVATNLDLYRNLIKKVKIKGKIRMHFYRNLQAGLYFWRSQYKEIENRYFKLFWLYKSLRVKKKKIKLINLYKKKFDKFMPWTFSKFLVKKNKKKFLNPYFIKSDKKKGLNLANFKNSIYKIKKKTKQELLNDMCSIDLIKKRSKRFMLKVFHHINKKPKINIKFRNYLMKKPVKVIKAEMKRRRYKLKNFMDKIKLKLIKVRKVFLLLIVQNLKNKFWLSLSILSNNDDLEYHMLSFLNKYLVLKKYILRNNGINYKKFYKRSKIALKF